MKTDGGRIRVLVVDDHPLLRDGVALLINKQEDMAVVGEANDGAEAIALFRQLLPDVTLMDLQMPVMDGIEAAGRIRGEFPAARIIMLTTYKGDVQALDALAVGVAGYILKDMARKDLVGIIREVHAGKRIIPPEIACELASHINDDRLTPRETEVLRCIALGHSNKLAARALDISEDTVKSHVRRILSKLGANDRTHALTIAIKRGIISL
jgi:DNA-binding NarL/FixJ family response regulator